MKKKKKIYIGVAAIIAGIYILLLVILWMAEVRSGTSTIDTMGKAVWYSIVTLSTVGYGDMTPVSPVGHVVGVIFLILSTGILVTLFGTVVSFLAGEAIPLMLLTLQKKRNWYYFADCGPESNTLARYLLAEDPDGIIIFGEKRDDASEAPDYPCMYLNVSPARIVERKKGVGNKCKVFLMKENDIGVNSRAIQLPFLPVDVYARTASGQDRLSGNINFFHSYDCCARQYWRDHPLCMNEREIVLLGFGNYGESLLERAILTNIISADQHVAYHIFGDSEKFLKMHTQLSVAFAINKISKDKDSLIFHKDSWMDEHDLLRRADRIIICDDNEQYGWDIYWHLLRYYGVKGRIDLRSNRKAPGVSYFGTNEDIYTPRHILRTSLNEAAITMNELYRESVHYKALDWDELSDFLRQSKIAAADHLVNKARFLLHDESITRLNSMVIGMAYRRYRETKDRPYDRELYRELEHMRWLRFYTYYNWKYGEADDSLLRTHPMIRPYAELSEEQKAKRDFAWELMDKISIELHNRYGH